MTDTSTGKIVACVILTRKAPGTTSRSGPAVPAEEELSYPPYIDPEFRKLVDRKFKEMLEVVEGIEHFGKEMLDT